MSGPGTPRWWLTTAAYLVGSLVGGLGARRPRRLCSAPPCPRRAVLAPGPLGAVALLLLVGLGSTRHRAAGWCPRGAARSTQQWLDEYRGWVMGWGSGCSSASASSTIITSATTYGVVLLAALSGQLGAGLAIGAVFGVVRALPSLLMGRVTDRAALHAVFTRVERWAKPARIIARVALGGAAAALLVAAVGS